MSIQKIHCPFSNPPSYPSNDADRLDRRPRNLDPSLNGEHDGLARLLTRDGHIRRRRIQFQHPHVTSAKREHGSRGEGAVGKGDIVRGNLIGNERYRAIGGTAEAVASVKDVSLVVDGQFGGGARCSFGKPIDDGGD